jgi:predicted  nucleic acid-binding Zn-ribbon protein
MTPNIYTVNGLKYVSLDAYEALKAERDQLRREMDEAWEQITLANSDAGDEARRANKVELDDARPTLSALQDLVRKFETALDLALAKCAEIGEALHSMEVDMRQRLAPLREESRNEQRADDLEYFADYIHNIANKATIGRQPLLDQLKAQRERIEALEAERKDGRGDGRRISHRD